MTSQYIFFISIKVWAILVSSGICSGLRYVGVMMYRGSSDDSSEFDEGGDGRDGVTALYIAVAGGCDCGGDLKLFLEATETFLLN